MQKLSMKRGKHTSTQRSEIGFKNVQNKTKLDITNIHSKL